VVKEVKKKILVVALVVAMLALPLSSALAVKPEKIELIWVGLMAQPDLFTGEVWDSGNIRHGRGHDMYGTYGIIGPGIMMVSNPSSWIFDYDINTETCMGNIHITMELIFNDGTFEGTCLQHGEFEFWGDNNEYAQAYTSTDYGVLHGTGAYLGQKIIFISESIEGTTEYTFYLYR
jgi:hypothetical protein